MTWKYYLLWLLLKPSELSLKLHTCFIVMSVGNSCLLYSDELMPHMVLKASLDMLLKCVNSFFHKVILIKLVRCPLNWILYWRQQKLCLGYTLWQVSNDLTLLSFDEMKRMIKRIIKRTQQVNPHRVMNLTILLHIKAQYPFYNFNAWPHTTSRLIFWRLSWLL